MSLGRAAGRAQRGAASLCLLRSTTTRLEHQSRSKLARHKVFWGLTNGSLHLDESSVEAGLVPRVLALLGNPYPCVEDCKHCHKASAKLLRYREESCTDPPPHAEMKKIRLSMVYRILRARPGLCSEKSTEKLLLERLEASELLIQALRLENKGKEDEIKRLKDIINSL